MLKKAMASVLESITTTATITGPHDAMYISIDACEKSVNWAIAEFNKYCRRLLPNPSSDQNNNNDSA